MIFLKIFDWYLKIFPSAPSATLLLALSVVAEWQDSWFRGLAASPPRQQTPSTAMFQGCGDYLLSEDMTADAQQCGIISCLLNEELSVFHSCSSQHELGLSSNSQEWIITSPLHRPGNFLFTHISTLGKYPNRASNSFLPFFLFSLTAHKKPLKKQTNKKPQTKANHSQSMHIKCQKARCLQYNKHFKLLTPLTGKTVKTNIQVFSQISQNQVNKQAWLSVKSEFIPPFQGLRSSLSVIQVPPLNTCLGCGRLSKW